MRRCRLAAVASPLCRAPCSCEAHDVGQGGHGHDAPTRCSLLGIERAANSLLYGTAEERAAPVLQMAVTA
jgi:hypothetical protein